MNPDFSLCNDSFWEKKKKTLSPESVQRLERQAESLLNQPGFSVVHKTVPSLSGNLHDYVSISAYDWPNPDTPAGIPWIKKDGVLNPDFEKYDYTPLKKMCKSVGCLAAASRLTGRMDFAAKAGFFLKYWFLDPETAMTPHFRFAQFVPGNPAGSPWGLIDSHFFCYLLEAASALAFSKEWTESDLEKLKIWFMKYFIWFISDPNAVQEDEQGRTNHGSWYDAQFCAIAMFLRNPDLAIRHIETRCFPRLDIQLLNNGQMPFELYRTASFSYSTFNLEAWSRTSAYAKKMGLDLWNHLTKDHASLHQAFEYMRPYWNGEKQWEYLQISKAAKPDRVYEMLHDFIQPECPLSEELIFPCCCGN